MANTIEYPVNPSIGDEFTVGGTRKRWDGEKWKNVSFGNHERRLQELETFEDYMTLKVFQSPAGGGLTEIQTRTVSANEVYEVRKTSDDSLATIYSDAAGTTEIIQNGIDNKSGSNGVVEFYIANGGYYVEVGGAKVLFTVGIAASDVDFSEYENTSEDIAQLRFSRSKTSLVLDKDQFSNADTFNDGNSLVLAYRPLNSQYANTLSGTQNFRYLVGGYDNHIDGQTPAELDGRACGHVCTHHSRFSGQSNHSVCVGGSYLDIQSAWYSFATGTQNTQLARSDIGYSAYNFMAGIHNQLQGNSNAVWGANNTLDDLVNGSSCGGSANNIKGSFSAAFGTAIVVHGDNSGAFGSGVQVGTGCFGWGRAVNASTANFSEIGGSENTNNSDYARTWGRGGLITGTHDHSDTCAHAIAGERAYTMTIPVQTETISGGGATLLNSIMGESAIIASETDSIAQFDIMLMASTADKANSYCVKVDAFARKIGRGAVEFLAVNVTDIYNTDPTEFAVTAVVGAGSNMQFHVNQGSVTNPVKWTGSIKCVLRQIV